jgi:hypothetical protein
MAATMLIGHTSKAHTAAPGGDIQEWREEGRIGAIFTTWGESKNGKDKSPGSSMHFIRVALDWTKRWTQQQQRQHSGNLQNPQHPSNQQLTTQLN